jgi:hypothetical protein
MTHCGTAIGSLRTNVIQKKLVSQLSETQRNGRLIVVLHWTEKTPYRTDICDARQYSLGSPYPAEPSMALFAYIQERPRRLLACNGIYPTKAIAKVPSLSDVNIK